MSIYKCSCRIYIIFYHMRPFNQTTATLVRPHPFSTLCTTPLGKMLVWQPVFATTSCITPCITPCIWATSKDRCPVAASVHYNQLHSSLQPPSPYTDRELLGGGQAGDRLRWHLDNSPHLPTTCLHTDDTTSHSSPSWDTGRTGSWQRDCPWMMPSTFFNC